ncbi:MAG: ParB/RepB/Spo0J family partition protein [Clostridia bacterium]|nr:ParB/RepB/Spo0J family partition protein [Clostridia bacterium]
MTENQATDHANATQAPEPAPETITAGQIFFLPIGQILPPRATKKTQNQNKLLRAIASLRQYGFAEPLLVQKPPQNCPESLYFALGGEEYLRAAALVGIDKIPCVLVEETQDQGEKEQILAKIRRKEGDMFATATAFRYLMEQCKLTQQEIAEQLGTSQSTVANKLRLLQFSPAEQEKIRRLRLSERHARAILRLQSPKKRLQALSVLQGEQLTVKETEALVEEILGAVEDEEGAFDEEQLPCEPHCPTHARLSLAPEAQKRPYKPVSLCHSGNYAPTRQAAPKTGDFKPVVPRRFALKTLAPLYNSLERLLDIFRKTGKSAVMTRAEGENGVFITIHIPL